MLIVELDGPRAEVEQQSAQVERLCRANGAFEIRVAADADERAAIWKGRKSAFAAVGRISPAYIVQDGVVPRTALPEVLAAIDRAAGEYGIRVANVFHAGDGNLHPLVLFDDAVPGQAERADEVSGAILDLCIEHGGSITGEHGVGVDKAQFMPRMFSEDDLDTMQLVRCAFDPKGLSNPGKIFPTPRLCGEVPGRAQGRPSAGGVRLGGAVLMAAAAGLPRPVARADAGRTPTSPGCTARRRCPRHRGVAAVMRAAARTGSPGPGGAGPSGTGAARRPLRPGGRHRRLDRILEHAAGDLVVRVRRPGDARRAGVGARRAGPGTRRSTSRCRAPRSAGCSPPRSRPAPAPLRHGRATCSSGSPWSWPTARSPDPGARS